LHQALDDWYTAPVKHYDAFAEKYPIDNFENETLDSSIKKIGYYAPKFTTYFTR